MKLVKLSTIIHTFEVIIEIFILELVLIETGTDIKTLIGFYSPVEYCSIDIGYSLITKIHFKLFFFVLFFNLLSIIIKLLLNEN
jgi:hypothetical protein